MQNVKDPLTVVSELVNLNTLYEKCLKRMVDQFGLVDSPRKFNQWDFLHCLSGQRRIVPEVWLGKKVTVENHPEWGEGMIIALKRVGGWYIPGVEFGSRVTNGHALKLMDVGNLGQEGHCRWVYIDDLRLVRMSLENRE
nr:MAG TPA: ATP-dependent DNA helicase [Caudoviricetes sp.]